MSSTSSGPETLHRILVVDDNRAIHDDFRKILAADPSAGSFEEEDAAFFGTAAPAAEKVDFDLDFASQGQEALDKVAAAARSGRNYAVAFVDVRMPPGLDGIETTARLWEIDPDVQVVICTAYSDYSWNEMVNRLGRTDRLLVLKKPFDTIEVTQCAHALAGKWSLMQQSRLHAESLESTVQMRTTELEEANIRLKREIDERRRSEEALRFTQFSVDNAANAMFWAAPNAGLLYVNSATCRALGYTVSELHKMSLPDIVSDLREPGWKEFWESLRESGHRTFETHHLAKDGTRIPIELAANFFTFGGQELLCASARDITRRKQILEELSQARDAALESVRLKSRFLANMSHEIRTPMNGVIGMAEVLLHTNLTRDQRDYIDTIRSSADLLLNIINDILDSSKIESGNLVFESRDFHLGAVMEGTLDLVGGIAHDKGLELASCVPAEVFPHLRGDPGRLRQVLTNIVANAVKFTDRGEVVVSVSLLEQSESSIKLRFEVNDTGIGIAEEIRQRIFEPFIQADFSDSRKYGGTGLGLSISRQIVEALGGKIGVDSEPGEGSTFWFEIDFEKQAAPAQPAPATLRFPSDLRVLVVDDHPTNRKVLQLQLTNLQMRSSSAADGEEALEMLRSESAGADRYDVAILDREMPVMDGLELGRQIKSDPLIAATRLILLSSLGDQPAESELAEAGVEGYLVKPIKQSRLEAALAAMPGGEAPASGAPRESQPESAEPPPPQPLRILLAEDNLVNQKVTLLQLQRLGYTADLASDGREALDALEAVPYDVILMDCQMPRMDGYAATREIRRVHGRAVRIIALTANAMQSDRETCLEAGMDGFLSKPVRPDDLGRELAKCRQIQPSDAGCRADGAVSPVESDDPVDLERLLEITGDEPEMFRQLVDDYMEQADEIFSHIFLAIDRRAPAELRQLAHKLGGSSASCGMRALVEPLSRLERIGEAAQFDTAMELYHDSVRQLARIRRYLIRHLADRSSLSRTHS